MKITRLRGREGYVARLPGFRGLMACGRTRKEAERALEEALPDWLRVAVRPVRRQAGKKRRAAKI